MSEFSSLAKKKKKKEGGALHPQEFGPFLVVGTRLNEATLNQKANNMKWKLEREKALNGSVG